jgi:hypothetical protein
VDHAATMRNTYERINAGDIAGFGDLVADDFVEHQGLPDLPTKEGTLEFFRVLLAAFPDWRMTVEDLIVNGDKTVARVTVCWPPRSGSRSSASSPQPHSAARTDPRSVAEPAPADPDPICPISAAGGPSAKNRYHPCRPGC